VEGSLRRQAELGRKRQAKAEASERRAALKEKKAAELRRLKNLKKAEILERLQAIEKVSGGAGSLEGVDLSGDFDPDAWDKQMAAVFNDDYYAAADPELAAELEAAEEAGVGWGEEEAGGEADVAPPEEGKRKRGGRRGKAAAEGGAAAGSQEAGPSAELQKTTQQYMDEYYALDYEDVLGEGEDALPTRFKYRAVEPAGFGVGRQPLPPHQPPARCPWECPSLPCPLPSGSDGPPPAHRRAADRPRAARARRQGARQDRPHPARQAAVCAVGRRARQVARQAGAVGGGGGAAC